MAGKERTPMSAVGGSSLLAVFAVLCLTVLALLSLETAQAESRMAQASWAGTQAYYEADCRAEEIFAALRRGELPPEVEQQDGCYRYTCPVSETAFLAVAVEKTGDTWRVLCWQTVAQPELEEQTWALWDGTIDQEETA